MEQSKTKVKVRAGQKRAQIAGVYPAVGPRGVGEVKEGSDPLN